MEIPHRFAHRAQAGELLAQRLLVLPELQRESSPGIVVLALPRGGLPVALPIAEALGAELDLFFVKKIRMPHQPELALGAIAGGGICLLNPALAAGLSAGEVLEATATAQKELELAEARYRDLILPIRRQGKTLILVDDGMATGSSLQAALTALRLEMPAHLIVALPVAPAEGFTEFQKLLAPQELGVCLKWAEPFGAVGNWYEDFSPVEESEVRLLMGRHQDHQRRSRRGS